MLIADPRLRNTIGYPKSVFAFDAVLRGKILIARLPQGRLGLQKTRMLGALLLARIDAAALARTTRTSFHIYIDECHHFATATPIEMLSGIRKFNVSLTLCHQYVNQLPPRMRDAVLGTVGTKIVFRVGQADAEALRHDFPVDGLFSSVADTPPFGMQIVTPHERVAIDPPPRSGEGKDGFVADIARRTETARKVRNFSRRHHTVSRKRVEVRIAARQDEARTLALLRADGSKHVDRRGALVVGRKGACSASGPAARDLVLLADTRFILPPQLDFDALRQACGDGGYRFGEVFLIASSSNSFCAWWRGRADSLANPSALSSRPTVVSSRLMRNYSNIHRARSLRRHLTTPSTAGIGPRSTILASARRCSSFSLGVLPGALPFIRPSGPRALKRMTQSRTI